MKRILGLSHITTEENCEGIKKNGFKKSISSTNSIQWLGEGVYFWNSADTKSLYVGKALVKRKFPPFARFFKTKVITTSVIIDDENYLDLDCKEGQSKFLDYLNHAETGAKLFEKMKFMNDNKKYDELSNEIGRLFGEHIEIFSKILNKKGIKILIVSFSFLTKEEEDPFYGKKGIRSKQYCLKDELIVNNSSNKDNWFYDYI